MEDVKKRKLDKATRNGNEISPDSEEDLRTLLDPLAKPQLVDLLAKLCVQLSTFQFSNLGFQFPCVFPILTPLIE